MTHLEKIRSMSAEELARWLIDDVEQSQDFSTSFCDPKYCPRMREIVVSEERGEKFEDVPCPEEGCLAAAVAYLNSEWMAEPSFMRELPCNSSRSEVEK